MWRLTAVVFAAVLVAPWGVPAEVQAREAEVSDLGSNSILPAALRE